MEHQRNNHSAKTENCVEKNHECRCIRSQFQFCQCFCITFEPNEKAHNKKIEK